jgi:hypothetical protein
MSFSQQTAFYATLDPVVGGVRASIFTTQWCIGLHPTLTQPNPINTFQLIQSLHLCLSQFQKHANLNSSLFETKRRQTRTQPGLVKHLPLATRAQRVENTSAQHQSKTWICSTI